MVGHLVSNRKLLLYGDSVKEIIVRKPVFDDEGNLSFEYDRMDVDSVGGLSNATKRKLVDVDVVDIICGSVSITLPAESYIYVKIDGEDKVLKASDVSKVKGEVISPLTGNAVEQAPPRKDDVEVTVGEISGVEVRHHNVFTVVGGEIPVRADSPERFFGKAFTVEFAKFMSDNLDGIMELEFDKGILSFVQVAKKRYAGWKEEDKFLVRGLELVRSDIGRGAKKLQKKVIYTLLHYETEVAREMVKDMIESEIKRFFNGDFTIDEVTLTSGIRDLDKYKTEDGKPPNLPQVAVALQLRDHGFVVSEGFKVEFIPFKVPSELIIGYVEGKVDKATLRKNVRSDLKAYEKVVARELVEDKFEELKDFVDVEYILSNQLLPPTERIANLLGIDVRGMMRMLRDNQTSLMKFIGAVTNREKIKEYGSRKKKQGNVII